MPNSIVKGIYRNGVAVPLEEMPDLDGTSVLIVFLEKEQNDEEKIKKAIVTSNRIHKMVKERIAARHPKSNISNSNEARRKFDQITEKVRKNMHWKDLGEMENAMRGEDFGLVRY